MKTRILIADDHAVVRRGLEQIIAETPDIVVAGEAVNGWEVLDKIKENDYDVIVMDIAMPGKDGIDVLTQLKFERPEIPVLMLSMYPEEQFAIRALKAGASGYLTKESAPDELVTAIRKVSAGGKYVSSAFAEKLVSILQETERLPHEALSNREYKVMCLIATGKTVTEIADELSLSVKTVSTYRSRILEKMKMKNNAELTYYAIKNKLVN
jgi:two-component system invasion response regulator UvrY